VAWNKKTWQQRRPTIYDEEYLIPHFINTQVEEETTMHVSKVWSWWQEVLLVPD